MGSMLIRNVDEELKRRLRKRAAEHGHSMEEEVRAVLRRELESEKEAIDLVDLAEQLFGKEHGIELEPHPASFVREPPDFRE
jgi:plasmid stability protein